MSWTPKAFLLKVKGAKHRLIDEYEKMAKSAMAIAYAQNAKRPREKKIYNAEKARVLLEKGFKGNLIDVNRQQVDRMRNALKGFKPRFSKKRGD
jgi:hypothetical protein